MKHSAIEALIRKEENLADEDTVVVKPSTSTLWDFKVICETTEPNRTITKLINIESHTLSVNFQPNFFRSCNDVNKCRRSKKNM